MPIIHIDPEFLEKIRIKDDDENNRIKSEMLDANNQRLIEKLAEAEANFPEEFKKKMKTINFKDIIVR